MVNSGGARIDGGGGNSLPTSYHHGRTGLCDAWGEGVIPKPQLRKVPAVVARAVLGSVSARTDASHNSFSLRPLETFIYT